MHHTWSLRLPSVIAPIAVLIGSPIVGSAEPVKMHTQCTCTCVAFDELGQRHDGSTFTFDTPGGDCSIGQKVGCYIGDLKGSYSSCTGKSLGTHLTPGGGAGVMQPPTAGGGMRPPAMGPVMGRGTDSEQPAASPIEQEDMAKGGEAGGTGVVQRRGIQRAPLGTIRAPVLGAWTLERPCRRPAIPLPKSTACNFQTA